MHMEGEFIVNGKNRRLQFAVRAALLSVLRENGYTEIKQGCAEGECGACLVMLGGNLVNACQVYAAAALETEIVTVKGLGTVHQPHPIELAFVNTGAVQCGFCTPGMVMATYALLSDKPNPSDQEIKEGLDGNLCRCTGYAKIIQAVKLAAEEMRRDG